MTERSPEHAEVELKFDLDGATAAQIGRHNLLSGAGRRTQRQESIYFDTANGDVRNAGYSLRVRRVGKRFIQTAKVNGRAAGLFDRREWEARVGRLAPDPQTLKQTPLGEIDGLLQSVAQYEVNRTLWQVDRRTGRVEVSLDCGTVSAGGPAVPFYELELELKGAKKARLFEIAKELGRDMPLQIGVLSKADRGLMVAQGSWGHAQKAAAIAINKDMAAGQVFVATIHECIRHLRLNHAALVAERDPEALHQARVALRRLRTSFALFRPAIRRNMTEPFRRDLHELGLPLGEARNLDVFLARRAGQIGVSDRRRLRLAQAEAYDHVLETLNGHHCRDYLLELLEWTASDAWQKRIASVPIGKSASKWLDAFWDKIFEKRKELLILDDKQLHRLRIRIKRMRYAVEFLAPLYTKKHVGKFISAIGEIQDALGALNDDIVSRQIASDLGVGEPCKGSRNDRSRKLKSVAASMSRLKRVGRVWRH